MFNLIDNAIFIYQEYYLCLSTNLKRMKLEEFVAVSGMPGLYRTVTNKSNGLIVEDLDSGKRRFASSRKHQFTPLATIGIYTDDDTAELKVVFQNMLDQLSDNPPPEKNADAATLTSYFEKILPEYDRDRVHIKDIKKTLRWFSFLHGRDLLKVEEVPAEVEDKGNDKSEEE